ncbi:hypothetical protein [Salinarimonas ramus]|uniref:Chemotaxis protein CheZ n=1 Tax=Salinarimonas ramus TaxID=690164 RepID=A0A917V8S7_9HYPH|nr:hypothetical protein [Salinarimonas ramus]GGK51051.1 hypothetical protein GCM10011322_42670 [Salinarimonas ramus]
MSAAAKPYRIERLQTPPDISDQGHANGEIVSRLIEIRQLLEAGAQGAAVAAEPVQGERTEIIRMKAELDAVAYTIERTKQEVATLHLTDANGREISRTSDELGAIVAGTEGATNAILHAAEAIDEASASLIARLKGDEAATARDIADQVVRIFEACNFQDITGQRVSKVLASMRFIEDRVNRMVEIWGGLSALGQAEIVLDPDLSGERALLNGPALSALDATTQAEIDALFD